MIAQCRAACQSAAAAAAAEVCRTRPSAAQNERTHACIRQSSGCCSCCSCTCADASAGCPSSHLAVHQRCVGKGATCDDHLTRKPGRSRSKQQRNQACMTRMHCCQGKARGARQHVEVHACCKAAAFSSHACVADAKHVSTAVKPAAKYDHQLSRMSKALHHGPYHCFPNQPTLMHCLKQAQDSWQPPLTQHSTAP
jgi:hypothetical protein